MNSELFDAQAQVLHDKYTRGGTLSAEEHAQLKSWYEYQDSLEAQQLNVSAETMGGQDLASLKAQIDVALLQLSTVAARIQTVSTENELLRQETERLRHRVADLLAPQSV